MNVKIWRAYGSEHSASLVLIGRFRTVEDAQAVEDQFGMLRELAEASLPDSPWEEADERLAEEAREKLLTSNLWMFGPQEVDIFAYEHNLDRDEVIIRITTDEMQIQGYLNLLINGGARIEIYSTHEWQEDGSPKVEESE